MARIGAFLVRKRHLRKAGTRRGIAMAEQRESNPDRERGRERDGDEDTERGAEPGRAPAAEDGKAKPPADGPQKGRATGEPGLFPTFSHRDD
ncbi:hypothetical protein GCM10010211_08350 [Streptomyces albospinus]|uniref:Uncharacterized protein n=1 Tax=Streptomyces albospinus TaxID=285515 RepID=A0ABQ2UQN3_9ACTN|nr:hypothetical protein [Streptomyces albospinus]GGU46969.1 hypothetical protein GCM10010211_08350 [Streptomyces albospinus]